MTFSQSFLDRYKDNAEMQEVIQNADARLVGASISDADKETIYESLYGFKHAIADKYGFDMDPIYDKLEKLGSIEHVDEVDGHAAGGVFRNHGSLVPDRPAYIEISDSVCELASDAGKKEMMIHELCHLYAENFEGGTRGLINIHKGACEILTQDATKNIMQELGYNLDQFDARLKIDSRIDSVTIPATGLGYAEMSNLAPFIRETFGERETYAAQFYGEKLPEIQPSPGAGLIGSQFLIRNMTLTDMEASISTTEGSLSFADYIKMQSKFIDTMDYALQKEDCPFDIANYMKAMQEMHDGAMRFTIDGQEFNSLYAQTTVFDIKNIYGPMMELSEQEIKTELNPLTRTDDCKNFLIAINGLKASGIDLSSIYTSPENGPYALTDEDKAKISAALSNVNRLYGININTDVGDLMGGSPGPISGMYVHTSELDGRKVIAVEVHPDIHLAIDGKIDEKTGMVIIDHIERVNEALPELPTVMEFEWDKPSYNSIRLTNSLCRDFATGIEGNMDAESMAYAYAVHSKLLPESRIEAAFDQIDPYIIADGQDNNIMHLSAHTNGPNATAILQYCIERDPEESARLLTSPNKDGELPLNLFLENGNLDQLDSILSLQQIQSQAILDAERFVYCESTGQKEPLIVAAIEGEYYDVASVAMKNIQNPEMTTADGTPLIIFAAEHQDYELLEAVTNKNTVNLMNYSDETALSIAVFYQDPEMTGFLLRNGADPELTSEGISPLNMALLQKPTSEFESDNRAKIVSTLIEHGADVNCDSLVPGKDEYFKPLQIAAGIHEEKEPNYEMVKLLLEKGADPLDAGESISLRDYAAQRGDAKLFEIMIESGVSKEDLDLKHSGLNPLEQAKLEIECELRDHPAPTIENNDVHEDANDNGISLMDD